MEECLDISKPGSVTVPAIIIEARFTRLLVGMGDALHLFEAKAYTAARATGMAGASPRGGVKASPAGNCCDPSLAGRRACGAAGV